MWWQFHFQGTVLYTLTHCPLEDVALIFECVIFHIFWRTCVVIKQIQSNPTCAVVFTFTSISNTFAFRWMASIDYQWTSVQVMAWCRTGDKLLTEPMLIQCYLDGSLRNKETWCMEAKWCIYALVNNWFWWWLCTHRQQAIICGILLIRTLGANFC